MAPVAAEFPLVKSGILYPFSSLLSRFLSASARKVRHSGQLKPGQKDKSDDPASRLKRWVSARDQVYDIFHSQSCRTFVGYDGGSIDRLLDDIFIR